MWRWWRTYLPSCRAASATFTSLSSDLVPGLQMVHSGPTSDQLASSQLSIRTRKDPNPGCSLSGKAMGVGVLFLMRHLPNSHLISKGSQTVVTGRGWGGESSPPCPLAGMFRPCLQGKGWKTLPLPRRRKIFVSEHMPHACSILSSTRPMCAGSGFYE